MSGRIFQNVVLQFKETTDRTIGVIDSEGTVIACSELTGIGKKWTKYVEPPLEKGSLLGIGHRRGGGQLRDHGGQDLQGYARLGHPL